MIKKIVIIMSISLLLFSAAPVMAATTQDVTVTATPSFISISNSPSTFDFGTIAESQTPNTTTGYFTTTNTSTVATDITIGCNGWEGGSNDWTYGAAGADTAQLSASSTQGGVGGSTGAGNYDKVIPSGSSILLCDALAATTDHDWEMQLATPTSFTYGNQQTTTVTLTAAAD